MSKYKTVFQLEVENKQLKGKLNETEKAFSKTKSTGSSAFGMTGIAGAIMVAYQSLKQFVGFIGDSIKAAIDFREESSKMKTVFTGVRQEAKQMRDVLVKSFMMSKLQATKLLGATGDMLTGFGFTAKAALGLSGKVNMLAADLASFTNAQGGAEAVSAALTKALLGERESLKTYGIALLDADIKQRLVEKGQKNLTGMALRQAKAMATLELAMEQSKNAMGDIARTSESAANQLRLAANRTDDFARELGDKLYPAVQETTRGYNKLISSIIDWIALDASEEIRKEQIELNGLVGALKHSWENQELRNRYIKELQGEYPDFLKNLNIEKMTQEDLTIALKLANEQYEIKIGLAIKEHRIAILTKEVAEIETKRYEGLKLINAMYKEKAGLDAKDNASLKEKMLYLQKQNILSWDSLKIWKTVGQASFDLLAVRDAIMTADKKIAAGMEDINAIRLEAIEIEKGLIVVEGESIDKKEQRRKIIENEVETQKEVVNILKEVEGELNKVSDAYSKMDNNIDNTTIKMDDFADKERMLTDLTKSMITSMGQGFEAEGLKDALKGVLNVLLDFAAAQLAIGKATAITKTIFGDYVSLGEMIAAMVALAAAKVAVSNFEVGTEGYKGGLAKVHKDEMTQLPTGSNVYTKMETRELMSNAGVERRLDHLINMMSRQTTIVEIDGYAIASALKRDKKNQMGN